MRTEPSGGEPPHKVKCMQYLDETVDDISLSRYSVIRARKALLDRQQTPLFLKQATFDNYGLARPRMPPVQPADEVR